MQAKECKRLRRKPSSRPDRESQSDGEEVELSSAKAGNDTELGADAVQLAKNMQALTAGLVELRDRFRELVTTATAAGPNLLVTQGSSIEQQFDELEKALVRLTPDRPCTMCPSGEHPCFRCMGGGWIGHSTDNRAQPCANGRES